MLSSLLELYGLAGAGTRHFSADYLLYPTEEGAKGFGELCWYFGTRRSVDVR
jgi:hypothetical protein